MKGAIVYPLKRIIIVLKKDIKQLLLNCMDKTDMFEKIGLLLVILSAIWVISWLIYNIFNKPFGL